MTAAKALKAQPILTALVACEACGEWTDRCACPDAAIPHPAERPSPWSPLDAGVGVRGGRTHASLVRPPAGRGRTSGGTGLSTTADTKHPAGRTGHAGPAGCREKADHPMSSTDHARPITTTNTHVMFHGQMLDDHTVATINPPSKDNPDTWTTIVIEPDLHHRVAIGQSGDPRHLVDALRQLADQIEQLAAEQGEDATLLQAAEQEYREVSQ